MMHFKVDVPVCVKVLTVVDLVWYKDGTEFTLAKTRQVRAARERRWPRRGGKHLQFSHKSKVQSTCGLVEYLQLLQSAMGIYLLAPQRIPRTRCQQRNSFLEPTPLQFLLPTLYFPQASMFS